MTPGPTVVIGGGISGLAAAWELSQAQPTQPIIVLEANHRCGGKLITEVRDGCLLEAAADSFLTRKPAVVDLVRELGLEDELISPQPAHRRSYLYSGGRLHHLPAGFSGLVPADPDGLRAVSFLEPAAIERILAEKDLPPAPPTYEESVQQFFSRRFGAAGFEGLFEPLLSGIYSGDATQLSAAVAFPQLTKLEAAGQTLLGSTAIPSPQPASPAFQTFRGGMAELPRALADRLRARGVAFQTATTVKAVQPQADGSWLLTTNRGQLSAGRVLCALPPRAAEVLLPEALAAIIRTIPTISVSTYHLVVPADQLPELPDGSGYVIPRAAGLPFSACTWSSRKWAGRASDDRLLLRFYFGSAHQPTVWQWSEADQTAAVLDHLAQWNYGRPPVPLWHRVVRWRDAMAQPNLGHRQRLAALQTQLTAYPGLQLAGAWFDGVGLPDSISRARTAAQALIQGESHD